MMTGFLHIRQGYSRQNNGMDAEASKAHFFEWLIIRSAPLNPDVMAQKIDIR